MCIRDSAPVIPVSDFFARELGTGKGLHKMSRFRQSLWWNHSLYAYLPPSPEHGFGEHLLVVLEELYTLSLWHVGDGAPNTNHYAETLSADRVGLSSPWAERLGWLVGSMFARIGTPDPAATERSTLERAVAEQVAGSV